MSNNISFVGRLGGDAEPRTAGNFNLVEFSVANNVGFGDNQKTNWFRCTIWGTRGEKIQQYLKKGKQVFITGELTLEEYQKDGVDKMSAKVKVDQVDFVGETGGQSAGNTGTAQQQAPATPESDEDLPF